MTKTVIVSAPGKLMLFGEHAVVQEKPCIVTAVNQRLKLTAEKLNEPYFQLEAKDVGIVGYKKPLSDVGKGEVPKGAKFVEIALSNFLKRMNRHPGEHSNSRIKNGNDSGLRQNDELGSGIKIKTISQFKSTFGFGSSSASTICTLKALSELYNILIPKKEFFEIAYKTVLDIQGVGSGFDIAAAIYGGTLYYVTGGKVVESLKIKSLPLIVGYTGVKADTATLVKEVNTRRDKYPKLFKSIFDDIAQIVEEAKVALKKQDFEKLGELMNLNQGYLEAMGVGSKELANLIFAARDAGAYGAKLSGAGVGDCMIAIAPPSKKKTVENAIRKAGGQVLKVEINAEGVKHEE